ncbi:hypothetical protein [Bradyrhizobium archetypum]|uniref:Uncharacterized protein n=1 Tax=Bradyrhizobium archetypum TaxID=2721160 RepID=A0A7Y4H1R6_9BRAD|nr:hypothetical protein [Bradyrhizobium archetypum]NOJ46040.1 hypothetical protein [Bradyrhizobium archetypum]
MSDNYAQLDRILSGVEGSVVAAKDAEILSGRGAGEAAKKVRALIETRLAIHQEKLVTPIPSNAGDRRLLLEILMRNTSTMPREVRMAYGAGKRLSNQEVSVLLRKLVQRGFFSSSKKK